MSSVREPIQVYLTTEERRVLDDAAQALGVSRSEVLRRGLRSVSVAPAGPDPTSVHSMITPAIGRFADSPPPSLPIAPLQEILGDLTTAREDR